MISGATGGSGKFEELPDSVFNKKERVNTTQKGNLDLFVTDVLICLTNPIIFYNSEDKIDSGLIHKLSDITSYYSLACGLSQSSIDTSQERNSEFTRLLYRFREIITSYEAQAPSDKMQFLKSEVIKMIDEEHARITSPAQMQQQYSAEAVGEIKSHTLADSREAGAN